MTSTEKWNLIVDGYKKLYAQPEAKVQAEWEMYCAELFEYKKILHEIDAQRHLTVGSGGAIIPDIILRANGNDIFDIELKQYSLLFNETFEMQLISYLNQTHLSVGMVVCNKIYLYYYEYTTISINKIEIPFEKDNSDGVALMEMITKDSFSADVIKKYILEKNSHVNRIREIKKRIMDDEWIKKIVKEKLLEEYLELDIDDALVGYSFTATETTAQKDSGEQGPLRDSDILPIIHQWCNEKMQKGEINFPQGFSNNKYIRFTTSDLDEIIPYQKDLKSGWNNGRFYAYEIVNYKGQFKMIVSFSNKNASADIRQAFLRIMRATGRHPQKEDWQWWCIFSTSKFAYNKNSTQGEIINALEQQFAQVRADIKNLLESI